MDAEIRPRRPRADAERSTAKILEAAERVLGEDPGASLERIADAAGLARATVHRRFASRQLLLQALVQQMNQRYTEGLRQARVKTTPPMVALYRLAELAFDVKFANRFAITLTPEATGLGYVLSPEVVEEIDLLLARLYEAGLITATDPVWRREVLLSLLDVVYRLPVDSSELVGAQTVPGKIMDEVAEVGARADLMVRTLLGALGGSPGNG